MTETTNDPLNDQTAPDAAAPAPVWYYAKDRVQHGPVSETQVKELAQSGRLAPADLVWREGMPQWQPAGRLPFLFPPRPDGPPPLPPGPPGYPPPPSPGPAYAPPSPYGPAAPPPYGARGGYPAAPPGYAYGAPPYPPHPRDVGQDAAMRWLIPVGRSGWAIAAGYLGLFSVLLVPAPIAVIISLIAIRDLKKPPGQHGMGRAVFGLIAGILGTLALVFVLVGAAVGS